MPAGGQGDRRDGPAGGLRPANHDFAPLAENDLQPAGADTDPAKIKTNPSNSGGGGILENKQTNKHRLTNQHYEMLVRQRRKFYRIGPMLYPLLFD